MGRRKPKPGQLWLTCGFTDEEFYITLSTFKKYAEPDRNYWRVMILSTQRIVEWSESSMKHDKLISAPEA